MHAVWEELRWLARYEHEDRLLLQPPLVEILEQAGLKDQVRVRRSLAIANALARDGLAALETPEL